MSYRPFFIYGDAATEPPETDMPNELCPECGMEFSGIAAHCEGCGYGEPPSDEDESDDAATSRDAAGILHDD